MHFILGIILAGIGMLLSYLMLLSILALFERRKPSPRSDTLRRFAWVVPAHNEEIAVERTIVSLLSVDYPRDGFDVYVIADNCTDATPEVARKAGAIVMERSDNDNRGKGQALKWTFERLLASPRGYDAFVVVDADSTVNASFLSVANAYLASGAGVLQCNDMVRKNPGAWSSEMTRIGFILFNFVRPMGRRFLGFPAGLRGNGMVFDREILTAHPWEAYSRAEDLEFGLTLLLHRRHVVFAPEAVVTATMPERPENAETQRMRWEGGRIPLVRRMVPKLLAESIRRKSMSCLDAAFDLLTPPLVTTIALLTGAGLLHTAAWVIGWEPDVRWAAAWFLVAGIGVAHMFLGLMAYGADRETYFVLLNVPRYAVWKVRLLLKNLFRSRTTEWIRTTREPVTDHHR